MDSKEQLAYWRGYGDMQAQLAEAMRTHPLKFMEELKRLVKPVPSHDEAIEQLKRRLQQQQSIPRH